MQRNIAIVLTVFAIGYFTALIVASGELTATSVPEDQMDLDFEGFFAGTNYVVELQDGIVLQSSLTVEHHIPHPLVGTIQTSEDGSTCWFVTEKIGVLYYQIMEECPDNV